MEPSNNNPTRPGIGNSRREESEQPKLTFGQKAVGANFNPSNDSAVDRIKAIYANAIDEINRLRNETESGEVKRMASLAITETQAAQMWAVKAITWKD